MDAAEAFIQLAGGVSTSASPTPTPPSTSNLKRQWRSDDNSNGVKTKKRVRVSPHGDK